MNRFVFIYLGMIWSFLGILIMIKPDFYYYGHHVDFTGYNIPLGIFMIVVGALFIWTTLKKKEDKEKE